MGRSSRVYISSLIDTRSIWPGDGDPVPGIFFALLLTPYAVVHVLDELVAGAGGGLEASSIEDPDLAAAVADQPSSLQRARGLGDADPPHSQHVPQEFVRKTEVVRP